MLHSFLAKKTRNRLRGPEGALFERSPKVGREERPPDAVVVHLNQVLQSFCFTVLDS